MHQAIRFDFSGMPASAVAESASRRRIRSLRSAHGSVAAWEVHVRAPDPEDGQPPSYTAEVLASLTGGDVLRAEHESADVLAALRLAFNAMERLLETDRESARARAAGWLAAVRNRRAAPSMNAHG